MCGNTRLAAMHASSTATAPIGGRAGSNPAGRLGSVIVGAYTRPVGYRRRWCLESPSAPYVPGRFLARWSWVSVACQTLAHPALANEGGDVVVPEGSAGGEGHVYRRERNSLNALPLVLPRGGQH
jgi:hypothetical protein